MSRSELRRYGIGQVSIAQLREGLPIPHLGEIDFSELVASSLKTFEEILDSKEPCHLLKKETLKCLLVLSDLLNISQFEKILSLFQTLFDSDQIDDFLKNQYLIVGICKVIRFDFLHPYIFIVLRSSWI